MLGLLVFAGLFGGAFFLIHKANKNGVFGSTEVDFRRGAVGKAREFAAPAGLRPAPALRDRFTRPQSTLLTPPAPVVAGTCDRCGVAPLVEYWRSETKRSLALCGHHARTHEKKLLEQGFHVALDLR